jgi:hypothetical protein
MVVDGDAFIFGSRPESPPGAWTQELEFPVWRSIDGERWQRVQLAGFDGHGWRLVGIAGGPLGWVMAGERDRLGAFPYERQIWFSPDWQSWELTRSQPVPAAPGAGEGEESYRDVAAGPEGFVVAGRLEGLGDSQARMLASADGRTWHVAPEQPALAGGAAPTVIAPLGGDWIAAGSIFDAARASPVWKSANGLDWASAALLTDPQDREGFGWGSDLVSVADRLFLSTWLGTLSTTELEAGVWTSPDGVNWELADLDPAASVSAALWLGDRWLLAGHISGAASRAVIWSSAGG